jgi:hypothetical protein
MSRTRLSTPRKDIYFAKTAAQVFAVPELHTERRHENKPLKERVRESDGLDVRRISIPAFDGYESTGFVGSPAEEHSQQKCLQMEKVREANRANLNVPGQIRPPTEPKENESESFSAQIRKFKERADLRECLLPGILGGVSPEACTGWQRQSSVRGSKALAKIKLEPCKKCRFGYLAQ